MKNYRDAIKPEDIKKGLTSALVVIHGQVAMLAQVDTGALRNSTGWATRDAEGGYNTANKGEPVKNEEKLDSAQGELEGRVGSAKAYAGAQELGLPDIPAYTKNPFIVPGFKASLPRARTAFQNSVRASVFSRLAGSR
jgi:hypothetical protein